MFSHGCMEIHGQINMVTKAQFYAKNVKLFACALKSVRTIVERQYCRFHNLSQMKIKKKQRVCNARLRA